MTQKSMVFILAAALAVSLVGCGGGSTPTGGGMLVRSATGGTVKSGGVTLVFPPTALASDTTITVSPKTSGLPATTPANMVVVAGASYALGPDGAAFSQPVTLTIAYDPAKIPAGVSESSLAIYTVSNGVWTPVAGSVVDTAKKTITASISHFSDWGVLAPAHSIQVNYLYHTNPIGTDSRLFDEFIGDTPIAAIQPYPYVRAGITYPGGMAVSMSDNKNGGGYNGISILIVANDFSAGSRFPIRVPTLWPTGGGGIPEPRPALGDAWLTYDEPRAGKRFYGTSGYVVIDDVDFTKLQAFFHFEAVTVEGAASLNLANEAQTYLTNGGRGTLQLDLTAVCTTNDPSTFL